MTDYVLGVDIGSGSVKLTMCFRGLPWVISVMRFVCAILDILRREKVCFLIGSSIIAWGSRVVNPYFPFCQTVSQHLSKSALLVQL